MFCNEPAIGKYNTKIYYKNLIYPQSQFLPASVRIYVEKMKKPSSMGGFCRFFPLGTKEMKGCENMLKLLKSRAEREAFPVLDTAQLKEIAEFSDFIEEKQYSKTLKIELACFSDNGIFIFLTAKEVPDLEMEIVKFKNFFSLYPSGIVIFVRCGDKDYYLESGSLHEVDDLLGSFRNLYRNTQLPMIEASRFGLETIADYLGDQPEAQIEESSHKPKVDHGTLDRIYAAIDGYEYREGIEKTKVIDGITYVRHPVNSKLFGYSYSEQYFPVADEDAGKFLLLTLFGGIFGFHKFKCREYLRGLFYLFTCGGFGVFYVLDVLSIATGTYYINRVDYEDDGDTLKKRTVRIYLPRLQKKLTGFIAAALSVLIAISALKFAYIPALATLSTGLSDLSAGYVEEHLNNQDEILSEEEMNVFLETIPFGR